jgi:formyl-CoA transferase
MPALDGMRVLDMTQYEAGTSCTQWLAWLGADVVKIEPPNGDPGRRRARGGADHNQYFQNYNANKRSVVINLRNERGRELLLDMAQHYDVFIENYGPGVIESLGLTYAAVRERNPSIIYARIKGFGLTGPHASYNAFDWVAQAAAGTFSVTGEPDGPPQRIGPTFGDSGAGMQMALGITAAWAQKQRTGEGQHIEISMQEAVAMFMRTMGTATWGKEPAPRSGQRQAASPPSAVYPCKGGGPNDYVYFITVTPPMWDGLCTAMDQPELVTDERFATIEARMANADALAEIVTAWTLQHDKFEAMRILAEAGVPASAVYDTTDLWRDPHLQERRFIQTVEHPVAGPTDLMRSPLLLSGSEVPLRPSPILGASTAEVLCADLGLTSAQVDELEACGAIGLEQP